MTNYEQWQVDRYGNILPPSGKLESHQTQPEPTPGKPQPRTGLDYMDLHKVAGMLIKRYEAAKQLEKIETNPNMKERYRAEIWAAAMHYGEMMTALVSQLLDSIKDYGPQKP